MNLGKCNIPSKLNGLEMNFDGNHILSDWLKFNQSKNASCVIMESSTVVAIIM